MAGYSLKWNGMVIEAYGLPAEEVPHHAAKALLAAGFYPARWYEFWRVGEKIPGPLLAAIYDLSHGQEQNDNLRNSPRK